MMGSRVRFDVLLNGAVNFSRTVYKSRAGHLSIVFRSYAKMLKSQNKREKVELLVTFIHE